MVKKLVLLSFVATGALLPAQDVPLQRPEERNETRRQSQEIYDAVGPVVRSASASTVWVWANGRQVAVGTVVGDGTQVLTKWSEIGFNHDSVQCVGGDGRQASATILGVYQDEDLALLQLEGARFTPVKWSTAETPPVGRFLVAAGPGATPLGVGVVAVGERVLRETDQAFIGVELDSAHEGEGVLVRGVVADGGAKAGGMKVGDVILELGGERINSAFELRAVLLKHEPGDELLVSLKRKNKGAKAEHIVELSVKLQGRPEFPGIPQARLDTMRRMGGPVSVIGNGFPVVIQTDMQLKPNQCGGPIVDLKENVIGMSISRTDRTRSFILPAEDISVLLGQKPMAPELAQLPRPGGRELTAQPSRPRPRAVPMNPGSANRLRQHLEEMQSLLERMDGEMQGIGE